MQLKIFLDNLQTSPESIEFQDTMAVIESIYKYSPTKFKNGNLVNQAWENEGSCKIFAFAKLNELSEENTLACFGSFYRIDVLQNPNGENHQNIRNFMSSGWAGVEFDNQALTSK
ncbi:MAG: HopJ type III effector protein [Gammaproteobacteria bacterium]